MKQIKALVREEDGARAWNMGCSGIAVAVMTAIYCALEASLRICRAS